MDITLGQRLTGQHTVTDDDTAIVVGSGDVPVLATPRLIALLEAKTAELAGSDDSHTTVGVHVDVTHLRPSAVGTEVTCTAELVEIDGRNLVYGVTATQLQDGREVVAGEGRITRIVIDRERFLQSL